MERWTRRIKRRLPQLLRIRSTEPERRKEERRRNLQTQAQTGDKAAIISDFANDTLADAQDYVLEKLLKCNSNEDLYKLQADYRAAVAFWQKVKHAIDEGKEAQMKLKKMEEEANE